MTVQTLLWLLPGRTKYRHFNELKKYKVGTNGVSKEEVSSDGEVIQVEVKNGPKETPKTTEDGNKKPKVAKNSDSKSPAEVRRSSRQRKPVNRLEVGHKGRKHLEIEKVLTDKDSGTDQESSGDDAPEANNWEGADTSGDDLESDSEA